MRIKKLTGSGVDIAGLIDKLRGERERIYAAYVVAAADPDFMRDDELITRSFDTTAGDGLRRTWP